MSYVPLHLFAITILLAAAFLLWWFIGRRLSPHVVGKPLLTANEREFFGRLMRALPGYHVFPQVSFGAFLTDNGAGSKDARWRLRASFDRKIADFLVCDSSMRILAIIELDDRTHNWVKDAKRDSITRAAGYVTIRFHSSPRPSCGEIAERVRRTIHAQA